MIFKELISVLSSGDSSCGLPFNPNLLMYLCTSEETAPLIKLQQDMFESYPGFNFLGVGDCFYLNFLNPNTKASVTIFELFLPNAYSFKISSCLRLGQKLSTHRRGV